MAKKKLRIALIGCGLNMTSTHVPRIAADGAVAISAVADPVRAAADDLMEKWGAEIPYHADWRQVLRDDSIDGVIISTPHDVHSAQVKAALTAGRHVLIEKPLTVTSAHSKALLALAERQRRMLVVAYQRHHMAPFVYARELVRKGRIGTIGGIVTYVTQNVTRRVEWRLDRQAAGGGMFADTGSHLVAASLWLTGLTPVWVNAVIDRQDEPVDVNMAVQVRYDQGALGSLNVFGAAGRHDERIALSGSKGSLVIHMHQWRFRSMLFNDEPVTVPKRVVEGTPDRAFFNWIRNGGKGYEAPLSAHLAVKLTEAAYRAAELGRPVRIRGGRP